MFVTKLSIAFLALTLFAYLATSAVPKYSTSSVFAPPPPALVAHLASTFAWSLSAMVCISSVGKALHKKMGYVAVISSLLMSATAIQLTTADIVGKSLEGIFHSFCNLQVSYVTLYLLGLSMSSILHKNRKLHGRSLKVSHLLIGANFLPRLVAGILRRTLGTGGERSFTFACALQIVWQVQQLHASRRGEWRNLMIKCNSTCLLGALVGLVSGLALGGRRAPFFAVATLAGSAGSWEGSRRQQDEGEVAEHQVQGK